MTLLKPTVAQARELFPTAGIQEDAPQMLEVLKPYIIDVAKRLVSHSLDSILEYRQGLYEEACAFLYSNGCATKQGALAFAGELLHAGLPEHLRKRLEEDNVGKWLEIAVETASDSGVEEATVELADAFFDRMVEYAGLCASDADGSDSDV